MKKVLFISMICCLVFLACKTKKDDGKSKFISAQNIIRDEITHIDTSLFSILQLNIIDSNHIDSSYIKREDFKLAAAEFFEIPDVANKSIRAGYKEESFFDESTNTVTISYSPEKPEKELIKRVDIFYSPEITGKQSEPKKIFIDYQMANKDSSVSKKFLWQINKRFQITSIKQLPGQPEIIHTRKVIWNDSEF